MLLLGKNGIVRVEAVLFEVCGTVLGVDLDVKLEKESETTCLVISAGSLTKGLPMQTTRGVSEDILGLFDDEILIARMIKARDGDRWKRFNFSILGSNDRNFI